jgi:hypothetical protein
MADGREGTSSARRERSVRRLGCPFKTGSGHSDRAVLRPHTTHSRRPRSSEPASENDQSRRSIRGNCARRSWQIGHMHEKARITPARGLHSAREPSPRTIPAPTLRRYRSASSINASLGNPTVDRRLRATPGRRVPVVAGTRCKLPEARATPVPGALRAPQRALINPGSRRSGHVETCYAAPDDATGALD